MDVVAHHVSCENGIDICHRDRQAYKSFLISPRKLLTV